MRLWSRQFSEFISVQLIFYRYKYDMDSLETENKALREKNKLLQKELDKVEFKYHKLKSQYVTLMKKCISYEMELSKCKANHQSSEVQLALKTGKSDSSADSFQKKLSVQSHGSTPPMLNRSYNNKEEPLFELFFILEPAQHDKYGIKYRYPAKPAQQLEHLTKRLNRYVYPNGVCLTMLQDDEQQSRHNELIFGNLCQQLLFILENDKSQEVVPALRQLNPSGKYFCYVFEKPTIMNDQKKQQKGRSILETTMAFCFITRFPFRQFFAEANRSLIQILKLKYIHGQTHQWKDFTIFNQLLDGLYNTGVGAFPIDCTWKADNCELKLNVQSSKVIFEQDKSFAENYIMKFTPFSLSQLIHYLMVERHILFFTEDKLLLNQIFEFIRIALRPLVWPFAILYNLTQELIPFLQSPVPVLIGLNKSKQQLEKDSYNFSEYMVMDLKEMLFVKRYDHMKKLQNSITQLSKHLQTQQHNRLSTVQWFIKSKLSLMKKSSNVQLGQFQQHLRQTQMVEQYLHSA